MTAQQILDYLVAQYTVSCPPDPHIPAMNIHFGDFYCAGIAADSLAAHLQWRALDEAVGGDVPQGWGDENIRMHADIVYLLTLQAKSLGINTLDEVADAYMRSAVSGTSQDFSDNLSGFQNIIFMGRDDGEAIRITGRDLLQQINAIRKLNHDAAMSRKVG